jgi:hypothetical protein
VKTRAVICGAFLALAPAAAAQSGADLLRQGVRSYQELNLDDAAGLLRQALTFQGAAALATRERAVALMYLTTVELLRSRRDSATSAARRLVLVDPSYRPDELVFPSQAVALFTAVRRATPAVTARAPADTTLRPGVETLPVRLYASAFHPVRAAATREDGRPLRAVYTGPIGDSLDVRWDGTDSTGAAVPRGRYTLTVFSYDSAGRVVRQLRLPLDVTPLAPDTHPLPVAPRYGPERTPFGPGWRALAPGALTAAGALVLPSLVAGGEDHARGRLVVAGAVTVAGIAAFFSHHPGRAIPENIAANRRLRDAWTQDSARVATDNARRKRETRLGVRAGAPAIITPEGP